MIRNPGGSARRADWLACTALGAVLLTACTSGVSHPASSSGGSQLPPPSAAFRFEPNQGQTDGSVKFLARGPRTSVWLTSTAAVVTVHKREGKPGTRAVSVRLEIVGARGVRARGEGVLKSVTNYMSGSDSGGWKTGIPNYAKVRYPGIYPGIDLLYHSGPRGLEHDFVVAAGAAPQEIRLKIVGHRALSLDDKGNLIIDTVAGRLIQTAPFAYQGSGASRRRVEAGYVLEADSVHLRLGRYDRSRRLVIDPELVFSTNFGGNRADVGNDVAVDGTGVYVTGMGESADFPGTAGGPQGSSDAFVAKMSLDGSQLLWSTYLGGRGEDVANGIAARGGSVYLTGWTSARTNNFPTTPGAVQREQPPPDTSSSSSGGPATTPCRSQGGAFLCPDGFVTRLDSGSGAVTYSSYVGGKRSDFANGIAVDAAGSIYLAGDTNSDNLPASSGAAQPQMAGGANTSYQDAFIVRIDPSRSGASGLVFLSYLGGAGRDYGYRVDAAASGGAFVVGRTNSDDFPVTPSAFQGHRSNPDNPDSYDAFIAKLGADGTLLGFSTYLGGQGDENATAVKADPAGAAYVTGYTESADFPGFGQVRARDGFLVKLNAAGSDLSYSVVLGGSGDDEGTALVLDTSGSAWVAGATGLASPGAASDFPSTAPTFGPAGGDDAFIAQVNPSAGSLDFSLRFGGSRGDGVLGIALDSYDNVYAAGSTRSDDFPVHNSFDPSAGDGSIKSGDAFVFRLGTNAGPPPPPPEADLSVSMTASPDPVTVGDELTYAISVANAGPGGASGVRLSDEFPSTAKPISATMSQGDCGLIGGRIVCSLGELAVGDTANISIKVAPEQAGRIRSTASVSAPQPDSHANNLVAVETEVVAPLPPPATAPPVVGRGEAAPVSTQETAKKVLAEKIPAAPVSQTKLSPPAPPVGGGGAPPAHASAPSGAPVASLSQVPVLAVAPASVPGASPALPQVFRSEDPEAAPEYQNLHMTRHAGWAEPAIAGGFAFALMCVFAAAVGKRRMPEAAPVWGATPIAF